MNDEMRLTIPAKSQMMLVARMALAGFCCQCGADVDTLSDVRTLSDEACYCLMHQSRPAATLTIVAAFEGTRAHIRFEAEPLPGAAREQSMQDIEIAQGILETLAAGVRLAECEGDMVAIEMDVHIGPL